MCDDPPPNPTPECAPPLDGPSPLPIAKYRSEILRRVAKCPVTFITGNNGSGKSIMVPQYLLRSSPGARVIVVLPNRLAAMSVVEYITAQKDIKSLVSRSSCPTTRGACGVCVGCGDGFVRKLGTSTTPKGALHPKLQSSFGAQGVVFMWIPANCTKQPKQCTCDQFWCLRFCSPGPLTTQHPSRHKEENPPMPPCFLCPLS